MDHGHQSSCRYHLSTPPHLGLALSSQQTPEDVSDPSKSPGHQQNQPIPDQYHLTSNKQAPAGLARIEDPIEVAGLAGLAGRSDTEVGPMMESY